VAAVVRWTGRESRLLRAALRMSVRDFAARTGLSTTAITDIEQKEESARPRYATQQILDTVLAGAPDHARHRIAALLAEPPAPGPLPASAPAGARPGADDDVGLAWSPTPAATVVTVAGLWRADMRRRAVLASAWVAAALAEPVGRWLMDPADRRAVGTGLRRVGEADVDGLWQMYDALDVTDHRLGGGYARSTLVHYADQVVAPLLRGSYSDAVGRKLFAAAASLCNLAGFMCFDSGRQGLGQRYFIQALRMAKVGGDPVAGANVLANLSEQARHQCHPEQAVTLAEAGVTTAGRAGSSLMLARYHATHARALALRGDARASDRALNDAERALERAVPGDEPPWVTYFTPPQLAAESMYVAADLGRESHVRHHATTALHPDDRMRRRRVMATATFAGSYLPVAGGPGAGRRTDVERACHLLREVLPLADGLASARAAGMVSDVRGRLARYAALPAVRRLDHDFP
jgi:transcriptional regulator with XRE-family HTH domain